MFHSSWWQMLVDFFCLSPWWAVGFFLKTHSSSPELEVILLKHLVMTQSAYQIHITCDSLSWGWPVPGKLDFVYFQTVPYIYMGPGCDDTSADESVSSVCVPVQRGWWEPPLLMWHRKHLGPILSTLTCAPKAPVTLLAQQCWGQLTN